MVNEGVSPVLQCGSADGDKIELEDSALNKSWYLLYRNQQRGGPIFNIYTKKQCNNHIHS